MDTKVDAASIVALKEWDNLYVEVLNQIKQSHIGKIKMKSGTAMSKLFKYISKLTLSFHY